MCTGPRVSSRRVACALSWGLAILWTIPSPGSAGDDPKPPANSEKGAEETMLEKIDQRLPTGAPE